MRQLLAIRSGNTTNRQYLDVGVEHGAGGTGLLGGLASVTVDELAAVVGVGVGAGGPPVLLAVVQDAWGERGGDRIQGETDAVFTDQGKE